MMTAISITDITNPLIHMTKYGICGTHHQSKVLYVSLNKIILCLLGHLNLALLGSKYGLESIVTTTTK